MTRARSVFCSSRGARSRQDNAHPQNSPTTSRSLSIPPPASESGRPRILASASDWQGVATTPMLEASPKATRLNSATVGETTKRLPPLLPTDSGSVTATLRGSRPSPASARIAVSIRPSRRASVISAVTVPPCCARRRRFSSAARAIKNPFTAPSSGVKFFASWSLRRKASRSVGVWGQKA